MKNRWYKIIKGEKVWFSEPLELNGIQYWNPTNELMVQDGWTKDVKQEPTAEELLAQAKAIKIDQIRAYNDSSEVNSFCVNGNPMGWLTPTQRMNYRQTVEAAQRKGMTIIPFMGMNIPVAAVLSAIDDLDIYAWLQTQCNEICIKSVNALTTVEEVEAYDFKAAFGMTPRPDFTLEI